MNLAKNKMIIIISSIVVIAIALVGVIVVVNSHEQSAQSVKGFAVQDISVSGVSYTVNKGNFAGLVVDIDENGKPTNLKKGAASGNQPDSLENGEDIAPDQTQIIKDGSGDLLTANDVAEINITEYDFNYKEIESTWGDTNPDETNSVDLDEMVQGQIPSSLRDTLLKSKVGSVFLWSTENSDDSSKTDVWVVTVIGKHDTLKVEDPNKATTK